MREEPGVVDPMNCVRVAFRACKIGGCGTGRQHDFILLPHRFAHRERHRRTAALDDDIDLVHVEPGIGKAQPDIRLVLMIGEDDLHLNALGGQP